MDNAQKSFQSSNSGKGRYIVTLPADLSKHAGRSEPIIFKVKAKRKCLRDEVTGLSSTALNAYYLRITEKFSNQGGPKGEGPNRHGKKPKISMSSFVLCNDIRHIDENIGSIVVSQYLKWLKSPVKPRNITKLLREGN
ncbi:MAG: hypothetical protein ACREBH_02305 [Candidatus Micrarchaeaceae archaeon]